MRRGSKSLSDLQQLFRFDVSVGEQVSLQVRSLIEAALTDWTSVRSLLKVEYFMNSQSSVLTESFPTIIAFEGFLFGVNISMIPGKDKVKK